MRTQDDNGYTYDDDPTTPEQPGDLPGNGEIRIKADINRRLKEYRAELAKGKKAKEEDFFTAQETLDFLASK